MLGWMILVSALPPEEYDRGPAEARSGAALARWETGLHGQDWLDELVRDGRAEQLAHNGYPNRFTALARDVLPLLPPELPAELPPGLPAREGPSPARRQVGPSLQHWISGLWLHHERIAACPPQQLLTIDSWDQS